MLIKEIKGIRDIKEVRTSSYLQRKTKARMDARPLPLRIVVRLYYYQASSFISTYSPLG